MKAILFDNEVTLQVRTLNKLTRNLGLAVVILALTYVDYNNEMYKRSEDYAYYMIESYITRIK